MLRADGDIEGHVNVIYRKAGLMTVSSSTASTRPREFIPSPDKLKELEDEIKVKEQQVICLKKLNVFVLLYTFVLFT